MTLPLPYPYVADVEVMGNLNALAKVLPVAAGIAGASVARLTADKTQTSSVDLTHANGQLTELDLAVTANQVHLVEYFYLLNAGGTAGDFVFDFTVPTGGAFFWQPLFMPAAASWSPSALGDPGTDPFAMKTGAATLTMGGANLIAGIALTGVYVGGANAGTLRGRFAQNSSSATGCKVLTNSIRRATLVA